MQRYSACLLALCVALLAAAAVVVADEEKVNDPDVLKLDKDNFDAVVNAEELILVEFYAPWCGHCKSLAPEYAKAATDLKKNNPSVPLAKVDATQNSELASKYQVSGYPTLKVFRNGKESPYRGPRDHEGIVNYMLKQVGPAAKPVASQAELDKYIKSSGPDTYWVAGMFKTGSPSPLQSAFVLTANKLRDDHTFLRITNPDLLAAYNVQDEGIVMFKTFDDRQTLYTGDTKPANLEKFILRNSLPIVGVYNSKTQAAYRKRGLPIGKLYVDVSLGESNDKHTKYFYNRLKPVAEEFRDDIVLALANTKDQARELNELNAAGATNPFVIETPENRKYLHTNKFTGDNIRNFVAAFKKGDLSPYVKSEEPPANNDGPVKVVTGKTFNEIVMNPEKDVLIEFYAPWCGHCKQLAPTYEKLGEKYQNSDSVVIAKIDATANDYPPEFQVSGYPTLFMVPAQANAKPIKFSENERDVAAFQSFIKKHAAKPIKKNKKKDKKE